MTTLNRALPLTQRHDIAFAVADYLHFNVARRVHEALDKDAGIAKARQRLGARHLQLRNQAALVVDDLHAATAPARRRF